MTQPSNSVKDHLLLERLSTDEYALVTGVLASEALSKEWPQAWAEMADDRLALARGHLQIAELIAGACRNVGWDPGGRSVISRAYYAMFSAVRAAVALEIRADENDHKKLPAVLAKTTSLGPTDLREKVGSTLGRFRQARNDADYSAYYRFPLEEHAQEALAAADMVLRVCKGWVATSKAK